MNRCDVCGNSYDKAFTIEQRGRRGTFDSFECAIHAFAPSCDHCGCRIIGHGAERRHSRGAPATHGGGGGDPRPGTSGIAAAAGGRSTIPRSGHPMGRTLE